MPKYRIIETRPATAFWEYVVEANDENEALQKILNYEVEAEDHGYEMDVVDDGDDDESTFEVFPTEEN